MGILTVTWNFPPRRGGIENLMGELCRWFGKKHPVFVLTSSSGPSDEADNRVLRSKGKGFLPFSFHTLWRGCFLLWNHREIQVVMGGSAMVAPLVLLLAKTFRRKAVVYVHGLDLLYSGFLYQNLCVRWIKCCDGVIANSRYTAFLAEKKGVEKGTLYIIPPGVDARRFEFPPGDRTKEAIGLDGKKVILFVGRLARRKGVKEFLEHCFVKVVEEVPGVCFVIVGENPKESLVHHEDVMGEIQDLLQRKGLKGHVRILGWLEDSELTKVYQLSDLVVLPAVAHEGDVEGFGIALIEAAAAGKPGVGTRVGGIPDAIEDGKSGILVNPGDYEHMRRVIVELLCDEQARKTLGDYARRRAKTEFDWVTLVNKYEALFTALAT